MADTLRLTVDTDAAALARSGRQRAVLGCETFAAGDVAAALAACAALFERAGVEGGSTSVWLGSAWARLFCFDWPTVALRSSEREALLREYWGRVLGDTSASGLWVEASGARRLSVAFPLALQDGLAMLLQQHRLRRGRLLPAVCGVLLQQPPRPGVFALAEASRATVVRCDTRGQVVDVTSRRCGSGDDPLAWPRQSAWSLGDGMETAWLLPPVMSQPNCVDWSMA